MYSNITKVLTTIQKPRLIRRGFLMGHLLLLTLFSFIFSSQVNGQAANIDQIRNGPANNPSKNFYDDFDNPTWVNGNAGASNAHYVEGHSIGYRSLITLLTVNNQYQYVIEYDTKHSAAMAIDYLTHFQRLLPHGQFTPVHSAEIINPRIFENNTGEYLFTGDSNTFAIPPPNQPDLGTPVSGLPQNSFNALPPNERLMTIYGGTISAITYDHQQSLTTSATSATTRVRITFTALNDSVVLAWGGHIASRLDWGSVGTPPKPRSAGGISGSPYHMRHINMNNFPSGTNISLGNQDRSLSAAAVIPPPDCPTVPSQTICPGGSFGTFTIGTPQAGATYTWSFGTNTAGAVFSGSNVGTSVTVVKSGGGNFTSGSFTLNIVALLNGQTSTCNGVATGTVETVVVNAAADPTSIDITSAAHSTTLTATIGAGSTVTDQDLYDYQWSIVTAGIAAGSLTNATSRVATYTANIADAGKTVEFKVIATQKDDANASNPECSDDATVSVDINSIGACDITASDPVCAGTEVTHDGSPDPKSSNATYTWTLSGFNGSGTTSATFVGTTLNQVQVKVNATQSYRITLAQTYANTALNTSCTEDVAVTATPSVSATYTPPACDETTFKVTVTSPTTGFEYDVSQPGNSINYTPITATAGNPVEFTGLVQGDGWSVSVKTGGPGCTASTDCATNPVAISSNSVVDPTTANKNASDLKKLSDNVAETYTITLPSGTKVKSLPNPYTDKVRFNLVSGISGLATLELHNVLGQKVAVVYQGYIKAGTEFSKEYFVPYKDRGTLIYTFRVGDQKISGKLLQAR
jgi:hypothetical protein